MVEEEPLLVVGVMEGDLAAEEEVATQDWVVQEARRAAADDAVV